MSNKNEYIFTYKTTVNRNEITFLDANCKIKVRSAFVLEIRLKFRRQKSDFCSLEKSIPGQNSKSY
jgi:hypothetical protein